MLDSKARPRVGRDGICGQTNAERQTMKLFAGLLSVLILNASVSEAQESKRSGHFTHALSVIQNSNWSGTFQSVGPGPTACSGSLTVKFFPFKTEPFSGGVQTVSYRHETQFSAANPFFPFCQIIGKSMSVVDLGNCDKSGLKKATVENGRKVMVPVRTIVPKSGGTRAVISSPTCVADGQGRYSIQRLEYDVQLEFTDERKRDAMTVRISLPGISVTYNLKRVGR
ncbi:MAG TPA: hypothetical protein VHK44_00580 [Xanthobacteraceae bacterium]|jgi:hypothetical protein|nr:hypothetical protein [Xanthobacteraceae bacterium]